MLFMEANIRQRIYQCKPDDTLPWLPKSHARTHNQFMEISEFGKRLKKLMAERGEMSQYALSKQSGVPQPTIQRLLKGETKHPSSETLIKLAKALSVDLSLMVQEQPGQQQSATRDEPSTGPLILGGPRALPIISYVQAGRWREIVDAFPRGSADDYVKPRNEHGPHSFALYVEGDSMTPEFTAGDIIIIDPDIAPNPGNYVIARNHEQEATFKKYRPRGRGADGQEVFELVPLNDDYATLRSDNDGAVIIGTVVEHIRILR